MRPALKPTATAGEEGSTLGFIGFRFQGLRGNLLGGLGVLLGFRA